MHYPKKREDKLQAFRDVVLSQEERSGAGMEMGNGSQNKFLKTLREKETCWKIYKKQTVLAWAQSDARKTNIESTQG